MNVSNHTGSAGFGQTVARTELCTAVFSAENIIIPVREIKGDPVAAADLMFDAGEILAFEIRIHPFIHRRNTAEECHFFFDNETGALFCIESRTENYPHS